MSEPEQGQGGSPIHLDRLGTGKSRTTKRIPRWTIAFLRALERSGDVRASAEDAGIDHSTAYARRRAHAEFAIAWDEALCSHKARVEAELEADVASLAKGLTLFLSRGREGGRGGLRLSAKAGGA